MTTKELADMINTSTPFWACGLIKETINIWKDAENYNLLGSDARMMADHYKEVN
jgi:hypothetical protein